MIKVVATHFDARAELPPQGEATLQPAEELAAAQRKRAAPLRGPRQCDQSPCLQMLPRRPSVHIFRQLQPAPLA